MSTPAKLMATDEEIRQMTNQEMKVFLRQYGVPAKNIKDDLQSQMFQLMADVRAGRVHKPTPRPTPIVPAPPFPSPSHPAVNLPLPPSMQVAAASNFAKPAPRTSKLSILMAGVTPNPPSFAVARETALPRYKRNAESLSALISTSWPSVSDMLVTDLSNKEDRIAHLKRKVDESEHEIHLLESVTLPPADDSYLEKLEQQSGMLTGSVEVFRIPVLSRVEGAELPIPDFAPTIVQL